MLCAAICRAAQTVISSQCKALFKEAVADSKTGNITIVPAIAILTEEEAEHPRPSSGWVLPLCRLLSTTSSAHTFLNAIWQVLPEHQAGGVLP